jgi:hypothetical protein
MTRIAVAVGTLAALALPAIAQPLPLPKVGSCPSGYASEAAYCAPMRRVCASMSTSRLMGLAGAFVSRRGGSFRFAGG